MQQFFAFGSSTVYWVWSVEWSYIDMLKQYLHEKSFSEWWFWEWYEVFNFWFAWATTEKVAELYPMTLKHFWRDCHKTCIINVWWNNMKAEDSPDGFVSTPVQFEEVLKNFLQQLQNDFEDILFVWWSYVDESKTTPKKSPLRPSSPWSRFRNERNAIFNTIQKDVSESLGITFIWIDLSPEERVKKYGYTDWLHNNTGWHRYYFEKILKSLISKWIIKE